MIGQLGNSSVVCNVSWYYSHWACHQARISKLSVTEVVDVLKAGVSWMHGLFSMCLCVCVCIIPKS